jgi:protein dithiol oxidoreductase (disulfide-forming)
MIIARFFCFDLRFNFSNILGIAMKLTSPEMTLLNPRRQLLANASLLATSIAASALLPSLAQAQPSPGKEYRLIDPAQPTDNAAKIEIVEFFWYGCPHCYALEAVLKEWLKKLPADVTFKKVHVQFQEVKHQQLFFTLQAMGKAEELTDKVFAGIHVEKNRLDTPAKMADYLAPLGVNKADFLKTFDSFGVRTAQGRATKMSETFKVDGVPAFAVNGKYYTAPGMAGNNVNAIKVVEYLIDLERKAMKK